MSCSHNAEVWVSNDPFSKIITYDKGLPELYSIFREVPAQAVGQWFTEKIALEIIDVVVSMEDAIQITENRVTLDPSWRYDPRDIALLGDFGMRVQGCLFYE